MNVAKVVLLLVTVACLGDASAARHSTTMQTFLAEIAYIPTADEVASGFHYTPNENAGLLGESERSADVAPKTPAKPCGAETPEPTQVVLARVYYYWIDRSPGVVSLMPLTVVSPNITVARGNLVELTLGFGPGKSVCAVVTSVRAESLAAGGCEFRVNKRGAVAGAIVALDHGGPGAASLFCPFFETEGWKLVQIGPLPKEYGGVAWSKAASD